MANRTILGRMISHRLRIESVIISKRYVPPKYVILLATTASSDTVARAVSTLPRIAIGISKKISVT